MNELKTKRKALGLTQHQLGQATDIPPWKITYFETGRVRLTKYELQRINTALVKRATELAQIVAT